MYTTTTSASTTATATTVACLNLLQASTFSVQFQSIHSFIRHITFIFEMVTKTVKVKIIVVIVAGAAVVIGKADGIKECLVWKEAPKETTTTHILSNIVFRTWSCLGMQAFDTFNLNDDVYTSPAQNYNLYTFIRKIFNFTPNYM